MGSHIRVDLNGRRGVFHRPHPEKTFRGNFVVRIQPELHREISVLVETENKSLNSLGPTALKRSVECLPAAQTHAHPLGINVILDAATGQTERHNRRGRGN